MKRREDTISKTTNRIKITCVTVWLAAGAVSGVAVGNGQHGAESGLWRSYEVYDPSVTLVNIRLAPQREYNHCVSVEWFDGLFYAAWNRNTNTYSENAPGRHLALATSSDFIHWTDPVEFVAERSENPIRPSAHGLHGFWQPGLLNYQERELWCLWSYGKELNTKDAGPEWQRADGPGAYLSMLPKGPGAKWRNQKILGLTEIEGYPCAPFVSGNPFLCRSGRVLVPVTMIYNPMDEWNPKKEERDELTRRWNVCAYSDDDGRTWAISNPISVPADKQAQWEPFFFEQADGKLRMFARNFAFPRDHFKSRPSPTEVQLTSLGTGSQKGEPVVFDPDARPSRIETAHSRTQVFRSGAGKRFTMLQCDQFVAECDGTWPRNNVALYFSRTGQDDFVAGPSVTPFFNGNGSYPQGVEHDGKIYVAYTTQPVRPSSIQGSIVDPAPSPDKFYIWARAKDWLKIKRAEVQPRRMLFSHYEDRVEPIIEEIFKMRVVEKDGREALVFVRRASAGVDTDPIDWARGDALTLEFEMRVDQIPAWGNLVFCSFGDRIPIRLGIPSFRPGRLYAYSRNEWEPVCDLPQGQLVKISLTVQRERFIVSLNGREVGSFDNPIVAPNPRLYLGDGYDVDYMWNNWGGEFMIDQASVRTRVVRR